jgi:hypothetical protein
MKKIPFIAILLSLAFVVALPSGYEPNKITAVLLVTAISIFPLAYSLAIALGRIPGNNSAWKMIYCFVFPLLFSAGLVYSLRPDMQFYNCLILLAIFLLLYELASFFLVFDSFNT